MGPIRCVAVVVTLRLKASSPRVYSREHCGQLYAAEIGQWARGVEAECGSSSQKDQHNTYRHNGLVVVSALVKAIVVLLFCHGLATAKLQKLKGIGGVRERVG